MPSAVSENWDQLRQFPDSTPLKDTAKAFHPETNPYDPTKALGLTANRFVGINSSGKLTHDLDGDGADRTVIGVVKRVQDPKLEYDRTAGVVVDKGVTVIVEAGDAFSAGDPLTADGSGRAIPTHHLTARRLQLAIALEDSPSDSKAKADASPARPYLVKVQVH